MLYRGLVGACVLAMVVPAAANADGPAAGVVAPGWASGATPVAQRTSPATALLPGGKVLIAGGRVLFGSALATAEVYDSATDITAATGAMSVARQNHFAVALPSGKVLVGGGTSGNGLTGLALATAALYDPSSGQFTATGSMLAARENTTAVLLPNGKVFVAGGDNNGGALNSAELYDPAGNTWSAAAPMTTARQSPGVAVLNDGRVLVAGGGGTPVKVAQIYNPANNTWAAETNMVSNRAAPTLTTLLTGKVLAAGGTGDSSAELATSELYDPIANGWTATDVMPHSHAPGTAVRLASGKVLITGSIAGSTANSNTADLYDPAAGTWASAGTLNGPRWLHTLTVLPTGQVVLGGTWANSALNIYTPATTLDSPNVSFGDQQVGTTRAPALVQLKNTGDTPLLVRAPALAGRVDFTLVSNTCTGASVAAGATCAFGVAFAPTGAGQRDATLSFRANVAGGSRDIALSGNGIAVETPTPTATATPIATVAPIATTAPVATPTPTLQAKLNVMNIAVAFTYSANAKTTKLATLSVKRVPAGSTVTVACPKSCAKKRFVKTNAKGTVSLKSLLTKPLKVNQTITITVAKAGYVTTIKTVKMRARKAPSITTRCVPAGEC